MKKEFISNSVKETYVIAQDFGNTLQPGDVIALSGNLGSGKTHFVQGLAKGLGITQRIISPTFVIVRSYELPTENGQLAPRYFYHVDLYRVNNIKEIQSLGLLDIMKEGKHILAIEWAEKMEKLLPKRVIQISFQYIEEDKRKIYFYKS